MKSWLISSLVILVAANAIPADEVDYAKDIKPLLAEKCGSCHGPLKQESGLRLDAGQLILQGSLDHRIVEPGNPDTSLMIERVSSSDPDAQMPPPGDGEPLSQQQIALLQQWIENGAAFPADEAVLEDPSQHWAYQIPRKTAPPTVAGSPDIHPIDAFVRAQQLQAGLQPLEQADRYTLLRRIYFDLIGLPPSREAINEFIANDSDRAIEQTIDQLLENPHFGERWGRHWMDVWRYSDWDGYKNELRGSQRHIWHWRDWIVRSLNDDKPYDRMILEMLAGDELAPTDPEALAATGYLARNYHKSNRNIWLDATVEHTAKAFLAMTLNCARCHDHKYDPISQQAYYEFRAIFEPHQVRTDRIPGQPDSALDGIPRAYDAELAAKTFLYLAGDEKRPDKDRAIIPGVPPIVGGELEVRPIRHPAESYQPQLRDFVITEESTKLQNAKRAAANKFRQSTHQPLPFFEFRAAEAAVNSYQARLAAERAKLDDHADGKHLESLTRNAASSERAFNFHNARLQLAKKQAQLNSMLSRKPDDEKKWQAGLDQLKQEIANADKQLDSTRTALQQTDHHYQAIGKIYPQTSTGRRLALARWIANNRNPLTARVAVNHIWMRHFGEPLVDNVFDFGLRSPRPMHQALLDWLAVDLMEHDWSLKHLHRLILTSQTWQQASSSDSREAELNRNLDPDNRYFWRMNARRMDAEIIRDNVLAVAGQLDPTLGGPEIDFRQGETSRRRSLYLRHAYEKQMTMLVIFDAANPNDCYRRSESVIPQQALALINSPISLDQSRILARKIETELTHQANRSAPSFLEAAFLQTIGRPPTAGESEACLQFLQQQTELLSNTQPLTEIKGAASGTVQASEDQEIRARENLVHVLMNHNDFLTVR